MSNILIKVLIEFNFAMEKGKVIKGRLNYKVTGTEGVDNFHAEKF